MDIQFQYPQFLWALAGVPFFLLLYIFYRLWRRRVVRRMGERRLIKELYKNHSPLKSALKVFLLLLAFSLGCIAIANPRRAVDTVGDVRKGIDVVIALDVSNSMLATDVAPNRLQQAQAFIQRLIQTMPDNRIGLVLFAGHAYLQMPLTFDHNAAQMFVAAASPGNVPEQGTAIREALQRCNDAFDKQGGKYQSIVLITDGETHDEKALDEARKLADRGVMINTVGIGSATGGTIMEAGNTPKRDASGNVIVSRLNEQLLQQLAAATKGTYVLLTDVNKAVREISIQLSVIRKTALGDASLFTYQTFYIWCTIPMLLLLLLELFLPDRKKVKV
ncbi:MAG: VWA domain-containing protein [Flavisolibacter sp.]|nr:VWA domain-containing protein [Flavisolibacter sp.]MBD0351010.1 VWA domain-containing protein [Flavisolibacter sp.]MBD0376457.1 VWA domain-containing protein [Flavisolibacter sp.]